MLGRLDIPLDDLWIIEENEALLVLENTGQGG